MHQWSCRFKPLPVARRRLPGHYHRLWRHNTVSADQLEHILPTPAATAPVGLLLQSAINRPAVIVIVGNLAPSLPPIPATTPSSPVRKMLTPTPRAPQASPLAHVKGLLQRQCLRLHVRCGTRTFHRRVRDPPPSSTYHIELLHPRLLPSKSSNRVVRTTTRPHRFVLGASQHVLLDHHPSPALLPHLPRTLRRHCLAIGALQHSLARPPAAFHRILLQPLHHPVPGSTYGVSTAHLRGAPSTDRRAYNATRQGYLQPGYYRVEPHLPFVLLSLPNHVS